MDLVKESWSKRSDIVLNVKPVTVIDWQRRVLKNTGIKYHLKTKSAEER